MFYGDLRYATLKEPEHIRATMIPCVENYHIAQVWMESYFDNYDKDPTEEDLVSTCNLNHIWLDRPEVWLMYDHCGVYQIYVQCHQKKDVYDDYVVEMSKLYPG